MFLTCKIYKEKTKQILAAKFKIQNLINIINILVNLARFIYLSQFKKCALKYR